MTTIRSVAHKSAATGPMNAFLMEQCFFFQKGLAGIEISQAWARRQFDILTRCDRVSSISNHVYRDDRSLSMRTSVCTYIYRARRPRLVSSSVVCHHHRSPPWTSSKKLWR